jgi:hypothetical protein
VRERVRGREREREKEREREGESGSEGGIHVLLYCTVTYVPISGEPIDP